MTPSCADGWTQDHLQTCSGENGCITVELNTDDMLPLPVSEILAMNRRQLRADEKPQSIGYGFIDGYLVTLGDLETATEDLGEPDDGVPVAAQHAVAAELKRHHDYVQGRPELEGTFINVAYLAPNGDTWTFGLMLGGYDLSASVLSTVS
jgi:hypothetical protein